MHFFCAEYIPPPLRLTIGRLLSPRVAMSTPETAAVTAIDIVTTADGWRMIVFDWTATAEHFSKEVASGRGLGKTPIEEEITEAQVLFWRGIQKRDRKVAMRGLARFRRHTQRMMQIMDAFPLRERTAATDEWVAHFRDFAHVKSTSFDSILATVFAGADSK